MPWDDSVSALTELQLDALTEVINLGMGTAAAALSEMVQEEITLSVPTLSFVSKHDVARYIAEKSHDQMTGVSQVFSGRINGDAILLFPEQKSLEIVRLLLKESVPLDVLTEMEQEALSENGNIILNAGLSSISNFLQTDLTSGLPVYLTGSSLDIMDRASTVAEEDSVVLFVRVDFGIASHAIDGYVVYMMSINSLKEMTRTVDNYLQKLSQAQG